jgi:hypothetical protein
LIVEVEDKVAALKDPGKKPRILSRNEAMIRELEAELSGRLRVEGQVYPDTFLRGLAARFRSLMMDNAEKPEWMGEEGWERIKEGQKLKDKSGKVVADSYYRKSRFLRDSRATEATLGKIIQEMTRQLGLPVIFEAPSQKTFMRRVGEEVEKFIGEFGRESDVRGLMKEWAEGKSIELALRPAVRRLKAHQTDPIVFPKFLMLKKLIPTNLTMSWKDQLRVTTKEISPTKDYRIDNREIQSTVVLTLVRVAGIRSMIRDSLLILRPSARKQLNREKELRKLAHDALQKGQWEVSVIQGIQRFS